MFTKLVAKFMQSYKGEWFLKSIAFESKSRFSVNQKVIDEAVISCT